VCLTDEIAKATTATEKEQAPLTPREQEVLHWVGQGKRNSEIATMLGCSICTVEKHMEHILVKKGVETRTGAVQAERLYT
jgi:DNA-binding NarL/FixJ family response regulator